MMHIAHEQTGFHGLGIAPRLLEILEQQKFTDPTPIQLQSIPASIEGKDVVGIAQTGTGKTLAFGVPLLQHIAQKKARGLILVPTRELAAQADRTLHRLGHVLGLRTAVLIGGDSMGRQKSALTLRPHIIIATPGRLLDHLKQRTVTLDDITVLILDEADRMFDMGFAPQITKILESVPPPEKRQTMLFSATMPNEILTIAAKHMALPVRIEVAPTGTTAEHIEQEIFMVRRESKIDLLEKLLKEYAGSVLIFTRTKFGAVKLVKAVRAMDERAVDIHSNKSLGQRREALEGFKKHKYRVLVATDIAARGIDVTNIALVINFDIPEHSEDYVHRIGRTGRAGANGKAITFATPEQQSEIKSIERLIQKTISVTHHESVSPELLALHRVMRKRKPARHQNFGSMRRHLRPFGKSRSSARPRRGR